MALKAEPRVGAAEDRRHGVQRMRRLATGLLIFMTAIFLAARAAPHHWIWAGYVKAFAEAAMVGACADWFAVTALFRRPFGLPIPHTAIIPRNKDRIGEALGDFIAGNFLTPAVLDERLRRLEPSRRLTEWLGEARNIERTADRIAEVLSHLVQPGEEWRELIGDTLRRAAENRPLAPTVSRLLDWLWREPGVQRGLNRSIEMLARYLAEHGDFIQTRMTNVTWRWTPKWVDKILAERLTRGLLSSMEGLDAPDHPWRADLNRSVEEAIVRLASDPDLIERGEVLKARWLNNPQMPEQMASIWSPASETPRAGPDPLLAGVARRGVDGLARWLSHDAAAQASLDRWIRVAARRVLSSRRNLIGSGITQVVAGWDAKDVADRLELQVGRDLQYIRINGTLVGGAVGLVLHALDIGLR